MDLTQYTDTEVSPVAREVIDGRDCFEMCDPDSPDLHCWGVYLRHQDGHAVHVADCPTQEAAQLVAAGLEKMLAQRTECPV